MGSSRRSGGRSGWGASVLLAVALVGGLSGCDGGGGSSSSSTSSGSASVSSSTTSSPSTSSTSVSSTSATAYVPVKPTFPAAARAHTDAGAVAFVQYYWAAVNYAWTKPDIKILRDLSLNSCESCAFFQDRTDKLSAASEHFADPVLNLTLAKHVVTDSKSTLVITEVKQLTARLVKSTGEVRTTQPADNLRRTVEVVWRGNWLVMGIGNE